ncbi:hypothetical protein N9N26_01120 [Candidatus Poseidoniales archaeon]|jgi:hypothetical protein|nr:hypothetical protein [Candidatus Poseidoniales archaeon]
MNLKTVIYHVKHPVVDSITAWWAYAGYHHEKATGGTTKDLNNYVADALSRLYDADGNSLILAVTHLNKDTNVSELSARALGD